VSNADGLLIGIEITPGQTHDVTAYPALMNDVDCDPEQMLGDKGYDSQAVRQDIERRGGAAVIPSLTSRKIQHAVNKAVYALRNRIERRAVTRHAIRRQLCFVQLAINDRPAVFSAE
jgi:transposase